MDEITKDWFKSSYSAQGGTCVETRLHADGKVEVRDTKDQGTGPVLAFSADAWMAFLGLASTT